MSNIKEPLLGLEIKNLPSGRIYVGYNVIYVIGPEKKLKKVDTFPSWPFSSITCDKFRKDHGFVNIEDNDICMECQIKLGINM